MKFAKTLLGLVILSVWLLAKAVKNAVKAVLAVCGVVNAVLVIIGAATMFGYFGVVGAIIKGGF